MNNQIWVFMGYIHKHLADIQCDSQLLLALADQRLLLGFAWLHLAAYKLPQQPSGLMGRALTDHKLALIPD